MFGRCTTTKRNSRSRKRWGFPQVLANTNSGYPVDISTMNSLRESMQRFPTSLNAITSALEEGVEFVLVSPTPNSWTDILGLHVAEKSVFINLARILWGFDINYARDQDGNIIPVDFTLDGLLPGAMTIPRPFRCCNSPSKV